MEKNQWNVELGHKMLECYNRILPLTETDLSYLAVCIAYPEKFWKSANSYYRSRKSWISAKSLEKLNLAIKQADEKSDFLKRIFFFQL
jgi:spore coat protein I